MRSPTPAAPANAIDAERSAAGIPMDAPNNRKRVMIVEDEALIALDLERRLGRLGFEVVGVADNMLDAIEIFTQTQPELVLMDISIRGPADGIETAQAIGKLGSPAVIFLTAYADEETVRRAVQTSPYGYMPKPIDERALFATIAVALERQAAANRLHLLGATIETASIGILLIDASTDARTIVFANAAFFQLSGMTRESVLGTTPNLMAIEQHAEPVRRLSRALADRTHEEATIEGRNARGEPIWFHVILSPNAERSGRIRHMLMFYRDITRERRAEAALAETMHLEIANQLTAGVAHDFNNLLCAISAFADLARDEPDEAARGDSLGEVMEASRRGQYLTRQLLELSRRPAADRTASADLTQLLTETRAMCERLAGFKVVYELVLDAQPVFVQIDATSLERILLNLVANARDAMPNGGRIGVRVNLVDEGAGTADAHEVAMLEISDTGTGMDARTAARIFELTFSTKPGGTGLGLATCRMLLERAGGAIAVRTAPGQGSTFTITLPLADGAARRPSTSKVIPVKERMVGASCLLVEDESSLRKACALALTEAGFSVVDVASAEGAFEKLDAAAPGLDLVITDLIMPGQGGGAVLEHALRTHPEAAGLVITGYMDEGTTDLGSAVEVLWKPFTAAKLVERAIAAVHAARRDAL
ncbi:MAG: response regulator [Proteobacteria bacterium]|nr:response regulator [Pseudomonadota bacterium]